MKAKELMIGDWVIHRGEPAIVYEIDDYYQRINTEPDGYDSIKCIDISEIEPIPITSEILEKNGFKGEMYAFLDISPNLYLEYYYHEHRLREWWTGIDEWNNDAEVKEIVFKCQCHYVHELQHALRLCGIEKEIVL